MTPLPKIMLGGVATSLLAGLAHVSMGQSFIDHLSQSTASALAVGGGSAVTVKFGADPLTRVAALSGADSGKRDELLKIARSVPGVADAHWVDSPVATSAAPQRAEAPAAAAVVEACQADVDAVVKGKTIAFATGTATLTAEGESLAAALATKLAPCSGIRVEVAGHTDAIGDSARNQALSEARAKSVTDALIAKGVPAGRLISKGYGATKPLATSNGTAANAKNRRIEFAVMAAK